MVIVMSEGASDLDVKFVVNRAASLGIQPHVTERNGQTVIGLLGDLHGIPVDALSGLKGVHGIGWSSLSCWRDYTSPRQTPLSWRN